MAEVPDKRRGRGRPPRPEPADPTGYRASEATRRHMHVACAFEAVRSYQSLIDQAVQYYLVHLRATNENYRQAAVALDAELASERNNITSMKRPGEDGRVRRRKPK